MRMIRVDVAICILLVTSGAKVVTLLRAAPLLEKVNPLFLLSNRALLTFVTAIEISVVALLLSVLPAALKGATLIALGSVFLVYRIFLFFMPDIVYCGCLGSLSILESFPFVEELILYCMIGYILAVGMNLLKKQPVVTLSPKKLGESKGPFGAEG